MPKLEAEFPAKQAQWKEQADKAKAAGQPVPPAPRAPGRPHPPGGYFNGMIHPLIPYPIRSAIWYQGESNAGAWDAYPKLFGAMVGEWRRRWGAEFPVGFVQLPRFKARADEPQDTPWARFREAQTKCLAIPGTAMAVIIDGGEADNIHPANKPDAGMRLALPMLAAVYGRHDVVWSGPTFKGVRREGDALRVSFDHAGGGLVAKEGDLRGFAVAGEDRRFFWAQATAADATVVVRSPDVPDPVAVRYAWGDFPDGNLRNGAGLPAGPFRSDDWPLAAVAQ